MVIDDEEILTKTFALLLKKQSYEVEVASRAEEAIAIVEKMDFDLVLCDIRMPGQNGVTTARQIQQKRRELGKGPVPLIFLTGYADPVLENQARELDPVAMIFKPFDAFELLDIIRSTLKEPDKSRK